MKKSRDPQEKEALFMMGYECNKRCKYCFNNKNGLKNSGPKINVTKKFVGRLKKLGVQRLYVTGGEPAILKDFDKQIKILLKNFKVILFTNGTLFNKYSPEEISSFGFTGINISIDLSTKNPADSLREEDNSFIDNLSDFYKINKTVKVTILCTFTKNLKNLKEYLNKAYIKKADRVFFQPLSADSNDSFYDLSLDSLRVKDAVSILDKIRKEVKQEDLIHFEILKKFYSKKGNLLPCLMGKRYFLIEPNGVIYACPHNKLTKQAGNILVDSPDDIITNLQKINEKCFSSSNCLSSKCICLYSHLHRRFNDE